jgi:hypothetical protein
MAGLRTALLTIAGNTMPARAWANAKTKPYGVQVSRAAGGVELRKENDAILLAPKHIFFVPEIAAAFDAYAHALPTVERDGVSTAEFASRPEALNICRRGLTRRSRHRGARRRDLVAQGKAGDDPVSKSLCLRRRQRRDV